MADSQKTARTKLVAADQQGDIERLAWSIIQSNKNAFLRAARAQRFAFATMKWMFLVIFLLALGTMIAAVRIATDMPEEGFDWAHAGVVTGLAAMSVVLFAVLLYMRPLAALERNSVIQSFLTVVVNSYWTRLLHLEEANDVDAHLEEATAYTVDHLGALLDRQLLGTSKYMQGVRKRQDEAGLDPEEYRSPL